MSSGTLGMCAQWARACIFPNVHMVHWWQSKNTTHFQQDELVPIFYMGTSREFWKHHQCQGVTGSRAEQLGNQAITILGLGFPFVLEDPEALGALQSCCFGF